MSDTLLGHIREIEARIAILETGNAPASLGWFNVRSYGAALDGTTDDTDALQDALDAAAAAGGGVVYVPAGTCLVTGISLTGGNGITLMGVGKYRSIIKLKATANATALSFYECNQLTICDLEVDGNKANQTANVWRGIMVRATAEASGGVPCTDVTIRDCYIHDTCDQGILLGGVTRAWVTRCHTARCGAFADGVGGTIGAGVHVAECYPDTSIVSSWFWITDCYDEGSGLDGATGTDLEGAGFQVQSDCTDGSIVGCKSINSLKYGFKIKGTRIELANLEVFDSANSALALQVSDVRGANIRTHGGDGIAITAPDGVYNALMDLANLYIEAPGTDGIQIANGANTEYLRNIHVSNCTIIGAADGSSNYGVRVRGYVKDITLSNITSIDCAANFTCTSYNTYNPVSVHLYSCRARESAVSTTYGFNMASGTGLLVGCVSESTGTAWVVGRSFGCASLGGCGMNGTPREDTSTATISSGAITAGQAAYIEVHPESGTADDLTDISDGTAGQIVVLKGDTGDTITVKHNATKMVLPGAADYTLSGVKRLMLICTSAGNWSAINA